MIELQTDAGKKTISRLPEKCPFCHKTIVPKCVHAHLIFRELEVILLCPNQACERIFVGYYSYQGSYYEFTGRVTIGKPEGKIFSNTINSISENFVSIYNQSFSAEQMGLTEICGVGYRKSLEFLIKEYIIVNNPSEKEQVEKKFLGKCISDHVNDERIKIVAKRAIWLGNDETHFIRKWEGKDLSDLKKLIELTVHWIEMELLTKDFEAVMPEDKL